MRKCFRTVALSIFTVFLVHYSKGNKGAVVISGYDSVPTIKAVLPVINEISGIADSKVNNAICGVSKIAVTHRKSS